MFLGIDFGKKRIGLALGQLLPYGAGVIDATQNQEKIIEQIINICQKNEVTEIVIGIPIRSQGEKGALASEIESFADKLNSKSGIHINYEPEQFTSVEAKEELINSGKKFSRKDGDVDELAAILILEQYINNTN